MRYRKLGKANVDTSVLSFGAMRLPMIGAKSPWTGSTRTSRSMKSTQPK